MILPAPFFPAMAVLAALATPPDTAGPPPPSDDLSYDGASGELQVRTPSVREPDVRVDGVLDEEAWKGAAVLQGFTQYEPAQGVPGSQRTEVLIFVSDDALFAGVRAYDTDPDRIRATLSERDGFDRTDDYVRFILDTFHDSRRAYVLSVNPYGVQHDGLWVEGGGDRRGRGPGPPIDDNPDFIWESDAVIQPWGWSVEIRVPFKSLRFPERPVQAWGFNVIRKIQRSGFEESWAPLSGEVANRLTESGALTDLRDLDPGLFLELNPVLTGKRTGSWDDDAGRFVRNGTEGDIGGNLTYGLTSNLTLDATYNPDFSQVEADAGQIAVNERFALYFPEKRPFFLEGTEVFSLPAQLVYTRSIVNPIAGAKVTGKVGNLNLGYLGAMDESLGDDPDAVVNLLRVRQDLGSSSTLGALFTDRTHSSDLFNRVGGLDARLVFGRRYTLSLLGAASWTADDATEGTARGSYLRTSFERAGRTFSLQAEMEDAGPDFRAGSGFIRRVGDTQMRLETRYNRFGEPGALVEQWGPSINLQGFWDHDRFWDGGSFKEGQVRLGARVSFRGNVTIAANLERDRFDYPAEAYDGLYVGVGDGAGEPFLPGAELFDAMDKAQVHFFFSNWEKVRGNARLEWGDVPIFDRGLGVPVEPGRSWSAQLSLNLFPTPRLQGEVGLRHETIRRARDDSRYSEATIPRVRAQYQFSRSVFVRTIFEYAAQERQALRAPVSGSPLWGCDDGECEARSGSDDYQVHVEGLVSYEPSPGTVMFLGYSRDMIDRAAFAFRALEPRADGLFAKVSYRFRF